MAVLWEMFCGYIQINSHKIVWMIILPVALFGMLRIIKQGNSSTDAYSGKHERVYRACLATAYSVVLIMCLFERQTGDYGVNLLPFASYCQAFLEHNMELWLQIFMNLSMYIPIGFFLPCCFEKLKNCFATLLVAGVSSVLVEVIQYVLRLGYMEFDDVFNNLLGAAIGYGLYRILKYGVKDEKKNQKLG